MAYASELALKLVPYTAGEQPKDRKIIKLNTNENPYPPSPEVEKAIAGLVPQLRLYPDMEATGVREAIADYLGLTPDKVFCGNGSDEVLAFAFAAFFAGKQVISPDISYSFYPVYASLFGAKLTQVPLREDFTVDVAAMQKDHPIVLANPNAPTSLALQNSSLRELAIHTRSHGEILLVDEAYAEFARENAVSLLEEFDNLLIVRTFSKSHGLAGMRVGFAVGSPELIGYLRRVRDSFNSYPLDRLAQAAAEAAMRDSGYMRKQCEKIIDSRDWAIRKLRENGVTVLDSQTNFLFVKADETDASGIQKSLREAGILVRHFKAGRLNPYLRISIGTQEEMEQVVDKLLSLIRK
ncbi:MAG: histidinol-phosphate transaminase [Clostridia bacterium]|nr:histidinol-phosphate transaminase [Clostridia bacterium]